MEVVPVPFSKENEPLLEFSRLVIEKGYVGINPQCTKLSGALRTVTYTQGSLNNGNSSFDNALDLFLKALKAFEL